MSIPSETAVAFIGAGNMAEALVNGIVRKGLLPAADVRVADVKPERPALLAHKYGVTAAADNRAAVAGASLCVLATKPQDLPGALAGLAGALPAGCLVLSIAAGLPTARLEALLPPGARVVRVMPNTPCLVCAGVSGLCGGKHATAEDLARAERIMGAVGAVHRLPEDLMDAVTAVSGSGPAYVFYLAEAMLAAAEKLGLPGDAARDLVGRTIAGAAQLMMESGESPAELRRRVTSKGGTTEAAIAHLEAGGTKDRLVAAIEAAQRRAGELSHAG